MSAPGASLAVRTYDESTIVGVLHAVKNGKLIVAAKQDGQDKLNQLALFDVESVTFNLAHRDVAPPPAMWQLEFSEADHVAGELRAWSQGKLEFAFHTADETMTSLSVPTTRVRAIWRGKPERIEQVRKLEQAAEQQDVLFVEDKQDELRSITGKAEGIDGDQFLFDYNDEIRRVDLARVVGVKLATEGRIKSPDKFHQVLTFASGGVISGELQSVTDNGALLLATHWGQRVAIPQQYIASISVRHGRILRLTDLSPARVEETPYFDRVMHYRVNKSLSGEPLQFTDGPVQRGIAVHSRAVLHYDLSGAFERFTARVGFQQPRGAAGRAVIRVFGDGKTLFELPDAKGDDAPAQVDVDVTGIRTLSLEVDFGEDQDAADRVVWADPQLIRASPAD